MKTEYIYTITPAISKGFNVYMSTKKLYGIEPIKGKLIAWFPNMKDAEDWVAKKEMVDGFKEQIKGGKLNITEVNF